MAALGNGNGGNKNFHLKVVARVTTTTGPNGAAVTREEERVFTLPLEPMMNEDTALPFVLKMVESFLPDVKIPMDRDVIVEKVVYSACCLFVATNDNNNKSAGGGGDTTSSKLVYSRDGLPLITVKIFVDHDGFVTALGDFESDDDDDSDDSDDDSDEEEVEAMEE